MAGILKCDQVQSDSNLSFQVAGANVAYMNSTGLQMTGGSLSLAGTTIIPAVGQYAFPATQNASADANTLDDYEEGTFTATLTATSAGPSTPITTTGAYTKIGKQVTITFGFNDVNTTGASGGLLVTGMPFGAHASIPTTGAPPMMYNLPSAQNYSVWYITGTVLNLYQVGNGTGWNQEAISAGASRYLWSTVTYITSV